MFLHFSIYNPTATAFINSENVLQNSAFPFFSSTVDSILNSAVTTQSSSNKKRTFTELTHQSIPTWTTSITVLADGIASISLSPTTLKKNALKESKRESPLKKQITTFEYTQSYC